MRRRPPLLALLFALAVPAAAQYYPLPAASNKPPAICTNCPGSNWFGQPNAGLPTWPYSAPIAAHTGRYVDSFAMRDYQDGFGMRTARAGKFLVAHARDRIYLQLGSTLAAYRLSTFFTQKLRGGMVPVRRILTGQPYFREGDVYEQVAMPDAMVYPEAVDSKWITRNIDGQDRLFDFDVDDRGYVHAAYSVMGWGIVKDSGEATSPPLMLPLVAQRIGDRDRNGNRVGISPTVIVSLRSGSRYYVLVSDQFSSSRSALYDVTDVTNIPPATVRFDLSGAAAVKFWAKNAAGDRIAYVDGAYRLQVYDVARLVENGAPIATYSASPGRKFVGVTSDGTNFWAIENNDNALVENRLWKLSPAGSVWRTTSYSLGPQFAPMTVHASDGYVAIGGVCPGVNVGSSYDVLLFDVAGGTPAAVDLKNYFRNYYATPPAPGWARPGLYVSDIRDVATIAHDGTLYLMFSMHGLGDVYALTPPGLMRRFAPKPR